MKSRLLFIAICLGFFSSCVNPKSAFESSYQRVVAAENSVGDRLMPISKNADNSVMESYLNVIFQENSNNYLELSESFRKFERSEAIATNKKEVIRNEILNLTRKYGAVLPVEYIFSYRNPAYTSFPWIDYVDCDDYVSFVEDNKLSKSIAAQKAWATVKK